jgi:NitT/TauT family transport system permease protein
MVISPSAVVSGAALIALAVWFPVTMLTASGISNTRASYLDVARTLGAGRGYLIFRVAVPAAIPNIFIGLFMGLGASFLTLVVAETVGVKSGLGWYVSWEKGWAEFGKDLADLVRMAAFSHYHDHVIQSSRIGAHVWQREIKWWAVAEGKNLFARPSRSQRKSFPAPDDPLAPCGSSKRVAFAGSL